MDAQPDTSANPGAVRPPVSVAEDTEERMRALQLSIVFNQALAKQAVSPLVAILVSTVLWDYVDHGLLIGWILLLAALSLGRHLLALGYRRSPGDPATVRLWEKRFLASLALVSAVWGIGGWLLLRDQPDALQAFVYCFVLGMAAGSASIYSAHVVGAAFSISLILVPSMLYLLFYGDGFHTAMGVAGIAFLMAVTGSTRAMNAALRRNIQLTGELELLARTDPLSGLANRRAFAEFGEMAVANAARAGRPCGVVMIDVDGFKSINDRHGHAAGDVVIRELGAALAEAIRVGECAGRIGGEEFAVVLPDGSREQGLALAQRIQGLVHRMRPKSGGEPVEFTVSIGVASTEGETCTFEELLARADRALYAAKHAGRNRTMVDEEARAGRSVH